MLCSGLSLLYSNDKGHERKLEQPLLLPLYLPLPYILWRAGGIVNWVWGLAKQLSVWARNGHGVVKKLGLGFRHGISPRAIGVSTSWLGLILGHPLHVAPPPHIGL